MENKLCGSSCATGQQSSNSIFFFLTMKKTNKNKKPLIHKMCTNKIKLSFVQLHYFDGKTTPSHSSTNWVDKLVSCDLGKDSLKVFSHFHSCQHIGIHCLYLGWPRPHLNAASYTLSYEHHLYASLTSGGVRSIPGSDRASSNSLPDRYITLVPQSWWM